ncbi:Helicase conserved C-terminal domain-containing protein [Butyrivibrio hungatei DSM 14810]|uniref:Helicase conserved C-terminal domain-containing protein n=1 Tax=Butyrivibrio hungatei DSM 14810 TaxID=1121132 RepID=A0A1M7SFC4_9FIRM|nr:DEAD/DEAH box helicase [Butyrivibrio hungatei]SHN57187.1 Helicase conserved C-terminal domain-containing protein [Butyrivibrio hungatei DSM 14810]
MLKPGLYEQVINNLVQKELSTQQDDLKYTEKIDSAEASGILSRYLTEVIKKSLDSVSEQDELGAKVDLVNKVVELLSKETQQSDLQELAVDEKAEQLLALLSESDPMYKIGKRKAKDVVRPETSVAQSSLFTGAVHEPQMYLELKKEMETADRIDMLVSFIKWSGLRLLIEELRKFTDRGGRLRIITTSYMGATDIKAVDELRKLQNTEVRISYDTKRTRLHAKAYIFYRNTSFTTAYIGSSNMSNVAMSSGLEWNIKATAKDMGATIKKIEATFESYWNSTTFEEYTENSYGKLKHALKAEKYSSDGDKYQYIVDVNPYPYQQQILDRISAEREIHGRYKNLIVAATGTGKTVIAALDYRRFCKENPNQKNRILFVAHREEILKQSLATFRAVLKNPNFGELFVGNNKPESLDNLFVSIQTVASQKLYVILEEDYYDYIVVDEFHHAAAPTYQGLLSKFTPKVLLGLTATPERMDGKSILDYFDGHVAAEIRLPEAIERKLLCPFQYFGVSDETDLSNVRWGRGGYDKTELSNLYSLNREVAVKRSNHIINSIHKYVTDMDSLHGLGFCVSVEHAKFMAEQFNEKGIPSIALTADSSEQERNTAKSRLVNGEFIFIFVVDLYNEGVDIPEVDTVLFLRPTESLTIFLQQLGRGLRLAEGKECLTVLDFIGQANKKYNFEEKFAALLSNTEHSVQYEMKKGFVALPKGCYIQLEKKASDIILNNIKKSFGDRMGLISRIESFTEDSGQELTLANFIKYYRLKLSTIYSKYSFTRLCADARVIENFNEPLEEVVTKAFSKIIAIDSRRWIKFLLKVLPSLETVDIGSMSPLEKRMLQMFYVTIWNETAENWEDDKVKNNLAELAKCKLLLKEIIDILEIKYDDLDIIDKSVDVGFECPLDLYCTYTRDQILVAMDFMKPNTVREGCKWLPEKNIDIFFVTLNKSDKDYSPTTMYEDYSINSELFHWQSQSTTSDTSPTGQRYINHVSGGSKILLFVREFKKDSVGTAPYSFLGTANYLSHIGSRPMNVIWRMDNPIPAKYLKKTNKLDVG